MPAHKAGSGMHALTAAEKTKIVELYLLGVNRKNLAKRFGCGVTSIRNCLVAAGFVGKVGSHFVKRGLRTHRPAIFRG